MLLQNFWGDKRKISARAVHQHPHSLTHNSPLLTSKPSPSFSSVRTRGNNLSRLLVFSLNPRCQVLCGSQPPPPSTSIVVAKTTAPFGSFFAS